MKYELDIRFEEAVRASKKMVQANIPQDVQLRLYAFYKQAKHGSANHKIYDNKDLRNAFKMNARLQVNHLSVEEAKEGYIEIIELIKNKY